MEKPPLKPRLPSRVTLRRLLSLARPELRTLLAGTFFLAIGSGMSLLYPQAMRLIIDEALGSRDRALIDRAAMWMTLILAIQALAVALRFYLFTTAGERVVTRLRQDLFASMMGQEVAFFDERKTGELTNRLASDTTVLQNTVSANISMVLRNLAQAVGGVALLFYTSPVLTLLMLAVVPAVAVGAVVYGRRVRKLSKEVQDALASSNEVAEESLSGVRTVRAFAAEKHEVTRYRNAVDKAFELARRRIRHSSTFMAVASFGGFASAAVVLWYGGRLVVDGSLSVGGLTSFLLYSLFVAFALGALAELWADFMRASGAAERVFELMDRQPTIPATGGERPATVQGRVELREVSFAYPTRPDVQVLQGIDLTIAPGEIVAIVGPSGAGKSTIASLLTRLYDPQEGRILVDGKDLKALDPEWLRQQIGVVAQEPLLFSSSIAENIRYGRMDASDAEVEAAARAANAHEFISRFPEGYRTPVGERGVQLSGGQKQRVAIARAVLKDPRLLILDEATSALDAESEHLVKDALERLMQGRTTLIIAHRLSTVMGADRVLVLEGGNVVQSGSHSALMGQEGLYRRLVERQFVAA
ncbi:ABC transporter ATP-binding protein [Stigmatella aurantiaca]|uniref:ATP-binding cassette, sub-family B (MDR/TAP), member 10 n=1 Tax=Stigmatella aurantiaca (strain DW4/3-1) TaxID=378806 RepID=Q092U1_STIAD|nr:ABC transporter transmembrane domain-containing protein [Stigmatella aurantiaca]ADO69461.1 Efflux ABC transporter, permease/ATP-binding protein [Stigmatella aurantiaca DW4/3-1]EAU66742.1 ATP-binding cassette, sub-family B (MDR/TAP), member 10 [Stigmatella aurantiaca DW4/3-1]